MKELMINNLPEEFAEIAGNERNSETRGRPSKSAIFTIDAAKMVSETH